MKTAVEIGKKDDEIKKLTDRLKAVQEREKRWDLAEKIYNAVDELNLQKGEKKTIILSEQHSPFKGWPDGLF